MDKTLVIIKNSFYMPVRVFLVLRGSSEFFTTNIQDIPFVSNPISYSSGYFVIEPGHYVSYSDKKIKGLNVKISFGDVSQEEPTDDFPNGINFVDMTINNYLEDFCSSEKISINCVNGINSKIKISMISGGLWKTSDSKEQNVCSIENGNLGENVGRIGVYPYGCDTCTDISKHLKTYSPKQAPKKIIPQKNNICEVKRDTIKNGGIVLIEFLEYAEHRVLPEKKIEDDEPVDEICCLKFC